MVDIIYPELSYTLTGLCFKVHNELGNTRSEKSYADALEFKLKEAGIKYVREQPLAPSFEGERERRNVPDFMIEGIIIVDTKAKRAISREDYYQMKRYLSVSNLRLEHVPKPFPAYESRVLVAEHSSRPHCSRATLRTPTRLLTDEHAFLGLGTLVSEQALGILVNFQEAHLHPKRILG